MLFAGDQDFICNYMGIESLIQNMEWNGEKGLGVCYLNGFLRFKVIHRSIRLSKQRLGLWMALLLEHGSSLAGSLT